MLAVWFFLFGSNVDGESASDPTLTASDTWCVWEMWDASRVPVDGAAWWRPESGDKLHKFSNDSLFLFHVSRAIDTDLMDATFQSMPYKSGYLLGTEEALNEWSENPGEMSAKWKVSNESYTKLSRKDGANDFFELQSGDDRMVVWGEVDEIEGFKSHAYLDRTVFIREQPGLASDLIEIESSEPLDYYGDHVLLGVTRDHREDIDMDIVESGK